MNQTTTSTGAETAVHPLNKSYTIVSKKHVDMDNLTAFEAVTMTMALVLAVLIGALQSTMLV